MRIQFFARLREALGSPALELSDSVFPMRVARLREHLREAAEGDFAEALAAPNLLCAVNQEIADDDTEVSAGDEVAFFPPVTGG